MAQIPKIGVGRRIPQLREGQPNNNFVRASEYNALVNEVNSLSSAELETATGSSTPTINARFGEFTSAALTTAGVTAEVLTVTNDEVTASSRVEAWITAYSGTLVTEGIPVIVTTVASAQTITITLVNVHATNAMNGTVTVAFRVY